MDYYISPHLHLTPLNIKQASVLLEAVNMSRESLEIYLPWAQAVTDLDSAQKYITERLEMPGSRYFSVLFHHQFIGIFAVKSVDAPNTCEIGYWLCEQARGHAVIARILRVMLPCLIEEQEVRHIEFHCLDFNVASIKIAQRVGAKLTRNYSIAMQDKLPKTMCVYTADLS
ncbi:N-acetyltransferase [Pseudoalteromonas rubra]|uniref:N-acetyltransferase n=1 Tax=Pseudoalteromonas rubra TaxID=43658 RepID=A0A5S3WRY7_9GAMM|nr:GNAT family N-acetyltransferase [Pseudoalteromonas rubra]TMP30197.1 N-acetyltransferase [Pseudoalteromonas rubra]TMP31934.1 N-acetyltransferase [Pseudoalteromonas rubra]